METGFGAVTVYVAAEPEVRLTVVAMFPPPLAVACIFVFAGRFAVNEWLWSGFGSRGFWVCFWRFGDVCLDLWWLSVDWGVL